jgi:hypothetical protein
VINIYTVAFKTPLIVINETAFSSEKFQQNETGVRGGGSSRCGGGIDTMRRLCQGVGVSSGLVSHTSESFKFNLLILNKVIYASDFCKPFLKVFYFAQSYSSNAFKYI